MWMERIKIMLATAFGLGLAPVAPGTVATLFGVALHLAIVWSVPVAQQRAALIVALIIVSIVHFWLTPWAQKRWQDSDPGNFVLDEVAGYLVVPIFIQTGPLWFIATAGFFLFRILDIIKIPPARQIDQQMHGGWGILLDDLVSGIYAVGVILLIYHFFPSLTA